MPTARRARRSPRPRTGARRDPSAGAVGVGVGVGVAEPAAVSLVDGVDLGTVDGGATESPAPGVVQPASRATAAAAIPHRVLIPRISRHSECAPRLGSLFPMSVEVSETKQERKRRLRSGIPADPDLRQPWPKRLVTNRLFWLSALLLVLYAVLLVMLYQRVVPDQEVPGGTLPGIGTEAIPIAAKYAAITAIPLSLIFLWADRFRPQRFWVWIMTFGWGACVATFVSAEVNTWAASQLSIIGDGDPATGPRAAIYVAPWVEEASKATEGAVLDLVADEGMAERAPRHGSSPSV